MNSYYYANYRFLTDVDRMQWDIRNLETFVLPLPYQDTFTLRCIIEPHIEGLLQKYSALPLLSDIGSYSLRKSADGWAFLVSPEARKMGAVLLASADYGDMELHTEHREIWLEEIQKSVRPGLPFGSVIRCCCEAGMVTRGGAPLHASLVEKEGEGVIFLGPSGMGKSTQAKLWQKHLGADFISGDRPGLRLVDGRWYAFGMPWDGKDGLHRQKGVPVRAFVVLEQAKENRIRPITPAEAKIALFHQAIIPAWDNHALDGAMPLLAQLSTDVPFYHLACRPDQAAVDLTYQTVFQ